METGPCVLDFFIEYMQINLSTITGQPLPSIPPRGRSFVKHFFAARLEGVLRKQDGRQRSDDDSDKLREKRARDRALRRESEDSSSSQNMVSLTMQQMLEKGSGSDQRLIQVFASVLQQFCRRLSSQAQTRSGSGYRETLSSGYRWIIGA